MADYAPKKQLPYESLRTPDIQFMTINNFSKFTEKIGADVVKKVGINNPGLNMNAKVFNFMPEIFSEYGIFLIEKKKNF